MSFPRLKNSSNNLFPVSTAYVCSALLLSEQNAEWKQFPESAANIRHAEVQGTGEKYPSSYLAVLNIV